MESGLEGISGLWKSLYKSGQNLSVDCCDHVNDDGSILFSTAQTELIKNQFIVRILKSVHTVSATVMFSLMEGNDINLNFKMAVVRKTDNECLVIVHPALVLKRDIERNKRLQDDRL